MEHRIPIARLFASLCWFLCAVPGLAGGPVVLVANRQPRAAIWLGANPTVQAREAAKELQLQLSRLSGVQLAVREELPPPGSEGATRPAARVLVGQAAAASAAKRLGLTIPSGLSAEFADEGYVVATDRDTLILAGNETEPYEGTCYAVYDLLDSLGCRWFFPGEFGEVLPHLETVAIQPCRRVVRPDFRVRDIWYSGHLAVTGTQAQEFEVWKRRNRLSQRALWSPGGPFLQNPTDDSTHRLLPKEKYWAAHPEFYALNADGTRNERFLCLSRSEALAAAAGTVVGRFREYPEEHAFAFSPPDAPVLCHCAECRAATHGGYGGEGYGEVSDPWFRFVFELAGRVEKVFPDRWIVTMAYYNRCRPPAEVSRRQRNVLVQLASIQQCSFHSYADPGCASRQTFGAMLRRWAELSAGQVFYEYDPHDWGHLQRPAWRGRGIAEDLRLLKRLDGWGFSNEGQMAWLSTGLNYYLHARLAWDVFADPAAIETDFARRFFGPAAGPMRAYYTAIEQAMRAGRVHYPLGFDPDGPGDDLYACFNSGLLKRCRRFLDQASGLAAQPPYDRRVASFRAHFDRLEAGARAREAMAQGDYLGAEQCGRQMQETVTRLGDSMLLQDVGPYGGRLSGSNVVSVARRVGEWAHGPRGRLVAVFAETALFRTDPSPEGVVQGWERPGLDERLWRRIFLTRGWHHQGYATPEGRRYQGVAWYRCRLQLDAPPPSQAGLYLPEVKGSAVWVWCNGRFAGYWERAKPGTRQIELSGLLLPGSNLVVLRVKGEGGLTLPPFVFEPGGQSAGPRLNSRWAPT